MRPPRSSPSRSKTAERRKPSPSPSASAREPGLSAGEHRLRLISIGREHDAQVFYERDYFCRMAHGAFEVLSITPGAYFYQTAVLLKRR
jgi:hypothetical protein